MTQCLRKLRGNVLLLPVLLVMLSMPFWRLEPLGAGTCRPPHFSVVHLLVFLAALLCLAVQAYLWRRTACPRPPLSWPVFGGIAVILAALLLLGLRDILCTPRELLEAWMDVLWHIYAVLVALYYGGKLSIQPPEERAEHRAACGMTVVVCAAALVCPLFLIGGFRSLVCILLMLALSGLYRTMQA